VFTPSGKRCFSSLLVFFLIFIPAAESIVSAEQTDMNAVLGEWARYDGDYTLRVRNVRFDGSAEVAYFNPGEINVQESNVSMQKGLVRLFVKLQDSGYPGSTYTLYYYAEKDALAGFYYQATMDQTFEVVFFRKE
jgi:hypothetical protein